MAQSKTLPMALIAVAVACIAIAAFYATQKTSILANGTGIHYKHAIVFAGLAIVALIGANITWRRQGRA